MVGVRLHALILAARLGVPFLAVAYDPKVLGLCEDLAYPLEPLWSAPSLGRAAAHADSLIDEAWSRHDELAAHLRDAYPAQRALAEKNFEVLAEVAGT